MEIWKDIKGYEGMYQISNLGRIKSLSKKVYMYNHIAKRKIEVIFKEKIRKARISKDGYYIINLHKNSKMRTYRVHRLVGENFIENINDYKEINHKDGNKSNNIIDNLEWCDRKHNLKEAYRLGLKETPKGANNDRSKKIIQYDLYTGNIKVWDSLSDAKREKNYSTGSICDACKGNIKTYKSSHWEYV